MLVRRIPFAVALSLALCSCKSETPTPEPTKSAASAAVAPAASGPRPSLRVNPAMAAASIEPPAKKPDLPAPDDVAAPPKDAKKTASGLATKVLQAGTGKDHPKDYDKVKVHYTGWSKDGKMFDSSVQRGEPTTFGVSQVIKGWTEGLQLMVVGEKRRLWIPAALAYGDKPAFGPAGDLTFDVELLEITAGPKPPEVPKDVKKAPADAKKTASGLAYRLLAPGKGTKKPTAADRVTVHYSGWTTDGKMFDSSVTRGEPSRFGVGQVIKGWTEGLQLMKEGDKMRFWIPADLAYGEKPTRPGAPAGMLVFDVELIAVN